MPYHAAPDTLYLTSPIDMAPGTNLGLLPALLGENLGWTPAKRLVHSGRISRLRLRVWILLGGIELGMLAEGLGLP